MERERYLVADLEIEVDAASVRRGAEAIELPRLSFDLLLALVRRAPAVASFDELIDEVWDGAAVADETLTQRVALLRRALGDDARSPRYVRTVRGRGYQLVAAVELLPDPDAEAAGPNGSKAGDPPPVAHPTGSPVEVPARPRRLAIRFAAVALLLLAAVLVSLAVARSRSASEPASPPRAALPVTRSADAGELMDRAEEYLRRHRREDNAFAIELYERALSLRPTEPRALAGLSLALSQRRTKFASDPADSRRAEELARRALGEAPESAVAHQALGLALDAQGRVGPALDAYRRSLDLDPEQPGVLASAAYLMQVKGHLADALEANLRVAESGAEPPYLEVQIGSTLALLGFEPAAAVWLERARELRPDNVFAAASYARLRLRQMRLDEADALAADALARGVRRPELETVRGDVALLRGDEEAAADAYRRALSVDPRSSAARSRSLALAARREQAGGSALRAMEEMLAQLGAARATGESWPGGAVDEAVLLTALGRPDEALAALDVAVGLGFRDADALLADPLLAPLRERPGFAARVETIRLRVEEERQRVLAAPWLPPSLLDGRADRR